MSNENHGLEGIQAPILEETSYDASKFKKKSLDDIQAPVLEDTYSGNFSGNASGLEGISAPALSDDAYTAPSSKSASLYSQIAAPELDIEPEAAPPPARQFIDPDLERAKEEGRKLAQEQGIPEPELTDEEKAKRRELNRQLIIAKNAAMAQKGAKHVIVLAVLGVISSVLLSVFMKLDFEEGTKELFEKISDVIIYYSVILSAVSVLIIPRAAFLKKLGSAIFGINTLLMLFPGSTMISSKIDQTQGIIFYAISLILSGYICFTLSSNENIDKYYNKKEDYYV